MANFSKITYYRFVHSFCTFKLPLASARFLLRVPINFIYVVTSNFYNFRFSFSILALLWAHPTKNETNISKSSTIEV